MPYHGYIPPRAIVRPGKPPTRPIERPKPVAPTKPLDVTKTPTRPLEARREMVSKVPTQPLEPKPLTGKFRGGTVRETTQAGEQTQVLPAIPGKAPNYRAMPPAEREAHNRSPHRSVMPEWMQRLKAEQDRPGSTRELPETRADKIVEATGKKRLPAQEKDSSTYPRGGYPATPEHTFEGPAVRFSSRHRSTMRLVENVGVKGHNESWDQAVSQIRHHQEGRGTP